MKKLLLAVALLAVGAWAGASWYAGTKAESTYHTLLESMNESLPFAMSSGGYESGSTGSKAVTHIRSFDAPDADILFSLEHDIQHSAVSSAGIGSVSIVTRVKKDSVSEDVQTFFDGFEGGEPFVMTTTRGIGGAVNNLIKVNAFEDVDENSGTKAEMAGGEITLKRSGDKVKLGGGLGDMSITAVEGKLLVSGINLSGDFVDLGEMFLVGSAAMKIDEMSFEHQQLPEPVHLKAFGIASDSSESDGRIMSDFRITADEIQAPVEINSARVVGSIKGLSREGVEAYMKMTREMNASGESVAAMDEQSLQSMIETYAATFAPGAVFDLDVGFTNDGGKAAAGVAVKLLDDNPENVFLNTDTLRELLDALRFEFTLDADAEAIDRTPLAMVLANPMAQDFVVSEEGRYKAKVFTDGSMLDINGEQMLLDNMLGEMMDMPLDQM
ncbi:MAG: hypothetical protein CSB44_00880 [Gammaproteobacteria bacterium]|nr:MAG: hypothetical protein CSB44_00880 [Gammaproteobacteria bacterium]